VSVRWHGMCELYRGGCGMCAVPESSEHGWDKAMNSREDRIDRLVRVGLEGAPQVLCVLLGMRSLIDAISATCAHQSPPLWLFESLQQRQCVVRCSQAPIALFPKMLRAMLVKSGVREREIHGIETLV